MAELSYFEQKEITLDVSRKKVPYRGRLIRLALGFSLMKTVEQFISSHVESSVTKACHTKWRCHSSVMYTGRPREREPAQNPRHKGFSWRNNLTKNMMVSEKAEYMHVLWHNSSTPRHSLNRNAHTCLPPPPKCVRISTSRIAPKLETKCSSKWINKLWYGGKVNHKYSSKNEP